MHDPKSAFTLTCPAADSRDSRVAAIRSRGNLPLMVDGQVLAEIDRAELHDSWVATSTLKPSELAAMTRLAGERLAQTLRNEIDSADLTDVVSDAAVLFLLTMRRYGANGPQAILPCTVIWDEAHSAERIVMRA